MSLGVLLNMSDKLSQLFKNIQNLELSAGLEGFILSKIEALAARRTRRNLIFSYAGLLGSVTAIVYSIAFFGNGVIESEFFSLFALAFSDLGTVLANWKDFSYSLMETFPAVYAALIAVPVFTLLLSLNGYLNNHNHNRRYNTA